jgi:hypothetical protein
VLEVEVDFDVELIELEVEEVEALVLEVEKVLAEVLLVEVVVPVGPKKYVAIQQTHWIDALAVKVAARAPPVVTNWSSAATATTKGAPADTRFTNPAPAEKLLAKGISPAPINISLVWVSVGVLPEFRLAELPVAPAVLSPELA